jgi:hypothetical protein
MVIKMENHPTEELEAIIPTEIVSSGSPAMLNPPPPPSENDQALIPPETVSNDSDMNPTVIVRRKAAKRTLPFDLVAEELLLVSSSSSPPPSPQAEDIPAARKKQRLEMPLPTTRDEAARKTASHDLSVGLPPPPAAADDDDANTDSLADPQLNARARTQATGGWTLEEDAKLSRAVANTSKKRWGKEYRTDWVASWGKNMHV